MVPTAVLLLLNQLRQHASDSTEALRGTVAGVVAMVPEGLVLLTSVAFAVGVVRLGRRRALVQELPAVGDPGPGRRGLPRQDRNASPRGRSPGKRWRRSRGGPGRHRLGRGGRGRRGPESERHASRDRRGRRADRALAGQRAVPFSSARKWSGATFAEPRHVVPRRARCGPCLDSERRWSGRRGSSSGHGPSLNVRRDGPAGGAPRACEHSARRGAPARRRRATGARCCSMTRCATRHPTHCATSLSRVCRSRSSRETIRPLWPRSLAEPALRSAAMQSTVGTLPSRAGTTWPTSSTPTACSGGSSPQQKRAMIGGDAGARPRGRDDGRRRERRPRPEGSGHRYRHGIGQSGGPMPRHRSCYSTATSPRCRPWSTRAGG